MTTTVRSRRSLVIGNATLYYGDNLEILAREIGDASVDLVYLDPPFNSSQERVVEVGLRGERRSFEDRFESIDSYVEWMRPRLEECVRVLRPGGTLFLHCDWRASHYLKVELDKLLGYQNFVNEIVWKRHTSHNDSRQGTKHFGRNVDAILFYGKGERTVWNPVFRPYPNDYVERVYQHIEPETGRRYALSDLSGPGGSANGNPVFAFMGVTRAWRYSKRTMQELRRSGRIVQTRVRGVPRKKRYLDEMPGMPVQAMWDDLPCLPATEREFYPTQKPVALLERILVSSTKAGSVVLDPFCGSGTTLVAAQRLGLTSIGIDQSEAAIRLASERVKTTVVRGGS